LDCQEEFFVNNPFDVKENDEYAAGFALVSHFYLVSVSLNFLCTAQAFFPECFSNN
jgi:hypothetical protein